MEYRVHIDIAAGNDLDGAIALTKNIINDISNGLSIGNSGIKRFQIRLGNDEDRQRSNYLDINCNGHCSTKKTVVDISENK